jgi:hypothetical protein
MRRLMNRLRLARGLRWQGALPTAEEIGITFHGVLAALTLVLLFGLVDAMERSAEAGLAEDRALAAYHQQQTALLACLNGGNSGLYTVDDDGHKHYIVCSEPMVVSTENVKGPR